MELGNMKVSANRFKIFLRELGDHRTTPVKYYAVMTTFINDDEKILVVAARHGEHKKCQFASNQTECACAICVQGMCLMCAHYYGVYNSNKRTQAVPTPCRTSQYDTNLLL